VLQSGLQQHSFALQPVNCSCNLTLSLTEYRKLLARLRSSTIRKRPMLMSVSVFAGMMVSPNAIFTPDRDATMRQGSVGLDTQVSGSLASSLLSHVHRVPLVRLLSFAGPCGGAGMSAPPTKDITMGQRLFLEIKVCNGHC